MTQKDFNLIFALTQEGLTNADYSLVCDIESTRAQFGTDEDTSLLGPWLAVYRSSDDRPFLVAERQPSQRIELKPDHILHFQNQEWFDGEVLLLFRFDNKEFD